MAKRVSEKTTESATTETGIGTADQGSGIVEGSASGDRATGDRSAENVRAEIAENSEGANDQNYQTIQVKPPRKPRKDKGQSKRAESAGGNALSIDQVSMTMCATASAIAVAITQREEAAMQSAEIGLIQPALADTLRGMGERAKAAVDQYSGMVMLAAGLGLWALRLSQLKPAAQPAQKPIARQPVPDRPKKANGQNPDDDPGHPPADQYRVLGSGADV